jgi:hypothetical protein
VRFTEKPFNAYLKLLFFFDFLPPIPKKFLTLPNIESFSAGGAAVLVQKGKDILKFL